MRQRARGGGDRDRPTTATRSSPAPCATCPCPTTGPASGTRLDERLADRGRATTPRGAAPSPEDVRVSTGELPAVIDLRPPHAAPAVAEPPPVPRRRRRRRRARHHRRRRAPRRRRRRRRRRWRTPRATHHAPPATARRPRPPTDHRRRPAIRQLDDRDAVVEPWSTPSAQATWPSAAAARRPRSAASVAVAIATQSRTVEGFLHRVAGGLRAPGPATDGPRDHRHRHRASLEFDGGTLSVVVYQAPTRARASAERSTGSTCSPPCDDGEGCARSSTCAFSHRPRQRLGLHRPRSTDGLGAPTASTRTPRSTSYCPLAGQPVVVLTLDGEPWPSRRPPAIVADEPVRASHDPPGDLRAGTHVLVVVRRRRPTARSPTDGRHVRRRGLDSAGFPLGAGTVADQRRI